MTTCKGTVQGKARRYESKARRVIVPQFRLLETRYKNNEHSKKGAHWTSPDYVVAESSELYYPNFPIIIQGNGEPWRIANLYLTTKLSEDIHYESKTYRGIADHLLDYLRYLEDEGLDYLHLPKNHRLKVTFRYRAHLISLRDEGKISTNTASTRINAVANFYRTIIKNDLINPHKIEENPFEEFSKKINITSNYGTTNTSTIKSHNLTIKAPKPSADPEYIKDGGMLRPLTKADQVLVLKALLSSSREYQLMFYLSLFTGARAQTVGTLRVRDLKGKLDGNDHLRLPTGYGTTIDTKRGRRTTILIPGWLANDILIYSRCKEAVKRRTRSAYGDTDENYVFLSKNGVPYYTSKKEIKDRKNNILPPQTPTILGHRTPSIQDGAALRQHIQELLLPRIRAVKADFQSFKFHDLRATFGMNLLETQLKHLGPNKTTEAIEYVQQRMGHSTKETTMLYLNYQSRLDWKYKIQSEFEDELFKFVATGGN